MLAAVLVSLDDHDAPAPCRVVPPLAAPAAVPAPVPRLVRAAGQRALWERPHVEARGGRVRDLEVRDVLAQLAALGRLWRRRAVVHLRAEVLAGKLVRRLVAHACLERRGPSGRICKVVRRWRAVAGYAKRARRLLKVPLKERGRGILVPGCQVEADVVSTVSVMVWVDDQV